MASYNFPNFLSTVFCAYCVFTFTFGSPQHHHLHKIQSSPRVPIEREVGVIGISTNLMTERQDNDNAIIATTTPLPTITSRYGGRYSRPTVHVTTVPTTPKSSLGITRRTTTRSRKSRSRTTTRAPRRVTKKPISTTTTTTTTTTSTTTPMSIDHGHKHHHGSEECKRHPERCHTHGGKHHHHRSKELPDELKSITWARYIDNSVLRLPFDQRTSGVNPNKAHNLGFGYPDIKFQNCTLPGDRYTLAGRCRYLQHCARPEIIASLEAFLKYSCIIGDHSAKDQDILGVCCPPDDEWPNSWTTPSPTLPPTTRVTTLRRATTAKTPIPQIPGCGLMGRPMTRVVGGEKAQRGKYPWMAAILRDRTDQFCGGALISDRHILTASHCVDNYKPHQLIVRLGEYNFREKDSTSRRDFTLSAIYMHEKYDPVTYVHDIAIIKLKEKMNEWTDAIRPICLPTPGIGSLDGKSTTVAGWGLLSENDRVGSDVLMEVVVPVMTLKDCQKAYSDLQLTINPQHICAGYPEGGRDSCSGDSGGPLMYNADNDRWSAVGVVSWGVGCAQRGRPGVYTRTTAYLDWISAKMRL